MLTFLKVSSWQQMCRVPPAPRREAAISNPKQAGANYKVKDNETPPPADHHSGSSSQNHIWESNLLVFILKFLDCDSVIWSLTPKQKSCNNLCLIPWVKPPQSHWLQPECWLHLFFEKNDPYSLDQADDHFLWLSNHSWVFLLNQFLIFFSLFLLWNQSKSSKIIYILI